MRKRNALQRPLTLLSLLLLVACQDTSADRQPTVSVHAVQGSGDSSPLEGSTVVVRGVVTGDFQDYGGRGHGRLGGFYIASLEADDNPNSSEGVFVFEKGRQLLDVTPGQVVDVDATVVEHFGETQLAATAVRAVGTAGYEPVVVELPEARFERFEGMLITIPAPLTIAGNRNLGRFGELLMAAGGRPYQFTNRNAPHPGRFTLHREQRAEKTLLLDDGHRRENPRDNRYASGDVPPRAGNTISGLTGNLRWSRGSGANGDSGYRLMPTEAVEIEPQNPRPDAPARAAGLRVVSLNLLNLFSGLDEGEERCGPNGDRGCRGADNQRELERQLDKIVATFREIDADVVGIMEIENNAQASLELLRSALSDAGLDYEFVNTGTIGEDSIKVGLLYRPAAVETQGDFSLLTGAVDGRFDSERNRPALAQTFVDKASGARLAVVVNHLKSKGSDCDAVNDPNRGDGQGNCNLTRTRAAAALVDWSAGSVAEVSDGNVLIIGDLNAYLREDPVRAIENGGFVNLLDREIGDTAYSFVYNGQAGALDHAFASPALAPRVRQTVEWHVNADEPPLFDYNLDFDRSPTLIESGTPWRASDHDPVVIDIDFSR